MLGVTVRDVTLRNTSKSTTHLGCHQGNILRSQQMLVSPHLFKFPIYFVGSGDQLSRVFDPSLIWNTVMEVHKKWQLCP